MTKKPAARKRGRPRLPPEDKKRPSMGFRPTPKLRADLEAAAQATGRSMSQEIEFGLEQYFLLENAKFTDFGGREAFERCLLFALIAHQVSKRLGKSWLEDKWAFQAAVSAWQSLLMNTLEDRDPEHEYPRLEGAGSKPFTTALAGTWKDRAGAFGEATVNDLLRELAQSLRQSEKSGR